MSYVSLVAVQCLVGFVCAALLTHLFVKVALAHSLLDIPNNRSSHTQPVPRGGGIAIVVLFVGYLAAAKYFGSPLGRTGIMDSLLIGGAAVAIIGLLDDLRGIHSAARLGVHFMAASLSVAVLADLPEIPLGPVTFESGPFVLPFLVVGIVWYVNLFNFMDGVDGIASIQAASVLLGGTTIMALQGVYVWAPLMIFLAACVLGFLTSNWSPAKVFMGDSSSGFLGFMLAILAISTSVHWSINLWSWLILGAVFFTDATVTLLRRIARGENWRTAHRNHAYQKLSRRFDSHKIVSLGVLLINVFWLWPFAFLAAVNPSLAALLSVVAISPLIALVILAGAGDNEDSVYRDRS